MRLKLTNHDQLTALESYSQQDNSKTDQSVYKPDLEHLSDNNYSYDSDDDIRSGCQNFRHHYQ